ncbi:hypothetical protein FPV67DRAFT_1654389 [Lyophyllum atratum]|nr:hypothetical protein FPV67DRAFT_1654389 [Lyophyllum atratum]
MGYARESMNTSDMQEHKHIGHEGTQARRTREITSTAEGNPGIGAGLQSEQRCEQPPQYAGTRRLRETSGHFRPRSKLFKQRSPSQLEKILRKVSVNNGDPSWRCCNWVWSAVEALVNAGVIGALPAPPDAIWDMGIAFAKANPMDPVTVSSLLAQRKESQRGPLWKALEAAHYDHHNPLAVSISRRWQRLPDVPNLSVCLMF